MRPSSRLTVAAGLAAGLGTMPLDALFDSAAWIFPAAAVIAVVTSFNVLARVLRLPPALVPLAGAAGLLLFLCFAYANSGNFAGLVPTGHSLGLLRDGLRTSAEDIRTYAAPAPTTQGLLLVVTLTAGLMTIVVDTIAVTARRPAVAGLVMLALYAVPTAISSSAVPWLLFVAAAGGYLVLLLAEERERLLRWGRPVSATDPSWQGDPAPVRFSGRRAGVAALAVAVVVPLFVPGISASGLSGLGSGPGDGPGDGTRIDPFAALKGNLNRGGNPIEMLRLSTGNADLRYLRTQVLDQYTDRGWQPSTPTGSGPVDGQLTTPAFGNTKVYKAHLEITGYADKYLPIPAGTYWLTGLTRSEDWQFDDSRSMVFSTAAQASGKRYDVEVAQLAPPVATLQQSLADDPAMQRWVEIPSYSSRFPPSIRNKVQQLTEGKSTPYDKVKAIRDYFSRANGFKYTTATQVGDTGSELADFVLEKKQGFCQQYAAAMAIMLRLAGVPSRVVIGFTRHTQQTDGYWSIQNTDAHAWVEAFFDSLGWIPFDPTPPDPTTPGRMAGFPPADPPYTPAAPSASAAGSAEPTDAPSDAGAPRKPRDTQADLNAAAGGRSRLTPKELLTILGVLLALMVLASPALARTVQRRRRLDLAARGEPGQAARAAWDELVATTVDLAVPLHPGETPRGVARRLVTELSLDGPPAAGLRLVALGEERARYARVAMVDGDLPTAVRAVRRGLAGSRRRRRRLQAALLPASVLHGARRAVARRNDQVSTRLDRLGADLRRAARPGRQTIRR
jgi:transglutaminase-like putative cysteine protease